MDRETMRSLIVDKDGTLSVREVPIPRPSMTQALVKIQACGICNGTDSKLIHQAFKGVGIDQYPLMLGHEAVGKVVELGSRVKSFKVGDTVLLPYVDPQAGYGSGWGAFSEYGVVSDIATVLESGVTMDSPAFPVNCPAQNVLDIDVDPAEAVVIITLREVLAAIRYFGIKPNESVAVFGCGPVGQTFVKFMHLMGIGPIFAVDIVEEKLKVAKTNGADYTLNGHDPIYKSSIRAICPHGVDYVFDAVGVSAIINEAMELIRDRGKICCYGISANLSAEIDWSKAGYNWQLVFQQMPRKEEEQQAWSQIRAWIQTGVVRLADFISDVYDFDHILNAFDKLKRKEIAGKCIIRIKGE